MPDIVKSLESELQVFEKGENCYQWRDNNSMCLHNGAYWRHASQAVNSGALWYRQLGIDWAAFSRFQTVIHGRLLIRASLCSEAICYHLILSVECLFHVNISQPAFSIQFKFALLNLHIDDYSAMT